MKKMIFLAAIAASVMTGCTNNEIMDISAGRTISFKNAAMTRNLVGITTASFNVKAFRGEGALKTDFPTTTYFSDTYTLPGGTWTTSERFYDGLSTFWFHCYGYSTAATSSNKGTLEGISSSSTISPTVPGLTYTDAASPYLVFLTNSDAGYDLVTAGLSMLKTAHTSTPQQLSFYHALARVRFTAVTNVTTANFIKIQGVSFTAKDQGKMSTNATTGLLDPMATDGASTKNYNHGTLNFSVPNPSAGQINGNQVFYIVPQDLTGYNVVVNYTIDGTTNSKTIPLTTSLVAGKSYNFLLNIDLLTIDFTVQLDEWTDVADVPVVV